MWQRTEKEEKRRERTQRPGRRKDADENTATEMMSGERSKRN